MDNFHLRFELSEKSFASLTKRDIHNFAKSWGFQEVKLAEIDIVVSEMISNLFKHTKTGGELLVKKIIKQQITGLEILCIDHGPGMKNPDKMLQDGVSTSFTLGHGLGSIYRLSDEFDMYSNEGWGTIILSRIFAEDTRHRFVKDTSSIQAGGVVLCKPGEKVCGDNWTNIHEGNKRFVFVADGLGHGEEASVAAKDALSVFMEQPQLAPNEQIRKIHEQIKKTRGVVGLVIIFNSFSRSLSFCGVGNISAKLYNKDIARSFISYNGIIGHTLPTSLNSHMLTWDESTTAIITSDGIKTRWEIEKLPNLLTHDSSLIAAAIYKDHFRGNDDATVVVINKRNMIKNKFMK